MPPRSSVTFDRFTFEPASGELRLDGRKVRLQPQPSRLLELLTARPGELVTREEIQAALWGGDTHVDFDRSLNFCVAKLRSALRDNAASPRFVETVPGRGYRFIARSEERGARSEGRGAGGEARDAEGEARDAEREAKDASRGERGARAGAVRAAGWLVAAALAAVVIVIAGQSVWSTYAA